MSNATMATQSNDTLHAIGDEVRHQHAVTHETAHRLALLSMRQWEKAITGVVAFPTALALGTAATVLMGTSVLERGFELLEVSVKEIGKAMGARMGEGASSKDGQGLMQ